MRAVAAFLVLIVLSAPSVAGMRLAEKAAPPPVGALDRSKIPDDLKLNILIRTTIIALNQANATGNYSVLRDLAAPGFQTANSQAQLVEIFAALRGRKLDLSPILFFEPKLVQTPAIGADGRLRLTGFFDTRPERVIFDLMFERVESDWRLFGIAIDVTPPEAQEAPAAASDDPAKKSTKAEKKK